MKILTLRNKEQEIINKIVNNEGIMDDGTKDELEFTEREITQSVDAYAYVLKSTLKTELEYWKQKKKDIESVIKRIANNKEYLEQQLHSITSTGDLIGEEYTIKPDVSVKTTVNTQEVEEPYGQFIVTLTGEEFEILREDLEKTEDYNNIVHKVLINDLPKNHKALEQTIRPTIKIIKTKR